MQQVLEPTAESSPKSGPFEEPPDVQPDLLPPPLLGTCKKFWEGLSTASGTSWVCIVVFALAEFGAACWYFTPPHVVAMNPSWIQESRMDDYVALSQRVLEYREMKLTHLQVAFLGASQATSSLTLAVRKMPDLLSPQLSAAAGHAVDFHRFTGAKQRKEDALFISDQFPPSFRGVTVLVVTDYQDDYEAVDNTDREPKTEETRFSDRILGLDAPSLEPVWAERGVVKHPTGNFFIDHLIFFSARRTAVLPFLPDHEGHLGNRMRDNERPKKAWHELHQWEFAPPEVPILTSSRHVITRFIKNLHARGVKVVLLEAPEHPIRYDIDTDGRLDQYRREMVAYAAEQHVEYWDLNEEADFDNWDFSDSVHLGTSSSRLRFQGILVKRLGAYIHENFPNEPVYDAPAVLQVADDDGEDTQ